LDTSFVLEFFNLLQGPGVSHLSTWETSKPEIRLCWRFCDSGWRTYQ